MLPDILRPGLKVVFVGSAKSEASAAAGHYYAHPSNGFWPLLAATGLLDGDRLGPEQDQEVLDYDIGLTDLVHGRAESSDSRLRAADFDAPGFVKKMLALKPRVVAFTSARSAAVVAARLGHPPPQPGLLNWTIGETLVYRLPSPSAANARGGFNAKRQAWSAFGEWLSNEAR